jgi:hypothetical protein
MGKGAMIDKILSACKDYHLPICFVVYLIGCVLQWFHHLDMAFVAYTGTVLGAITGHAFSPAGQQDQVPPTPPDTIGGNNGTK